MIKAHDMMPKKIRIHDTWSRGEHNLVGITRQSPSTTQFNSRLSVYKGLHGASWESIACQYYQEVDIEYLAYNLRSISRSTLTTHRRTRNSETLLMLSWKMWVTRIAYCVERRLNVIPCCLWFIYSRARRHHVCTRVHKLLLLVV